MKKYRLAPYYSMRIEEVNLLKQTAKMYTCEEVWGQKAYKRSYRTDKHPIYDTFDEAKQALVEHYEKKVEEAEDLLHRIKDEVTKARAVHEAVKC